MGIKGLPVKAEFLHIEFCLKVKKGAPVMGGVTTLYHERKIAGLRRDSIDNRNVRRLQPHFNGLIPNRNSIIVKIQFYRSVCITLSSSGDRVRADESDETKET